MSTPSTVPSTPEILLTELLNHLEMQDYPMEAITPMRAFLVSIETFLDELRAFDQECAAEEHTDTVVLWEKIVTPRIDRWRPVADAETCEHPDPDSEQEICRTCGERVDLEPKEKNQ